MKKIFFLIISIFLILNSTSINCVPSPAYVNAWSDGNRFADFNNPEWRSGPLRKEVEWRNPFNRPFEYVRYSEMGSWTQASPYVQYYGYARNYFPYGHAVSPYSSFDGRHNTYYRGVMHNGHNYRNVRWAR